jgi:hypothetical protein
MDTFTSLARRRNRPTVVRVPGIYPSKTYGRICYLECDSRQVARRALACAELHMRIFFELGISATHREAIADDYDQRFPSDEHSIVGPGSAGVVYGEPATFKVDEQATLWECVKRNPDGMSVRRKLNKVFPVLSGILFSL